eukprot:CAMPEP_0172564002 /NCGR_PEP_ID=MMETSP1067-20121228/102653_1 /TAXON_ID=265564 ORGANISM="Thalassiosira punctigera, Strain Tpunct2005C2" /NCGR_SAMPLE_ID=MMETSP1067 /ASSEMBLY_ACC=CAM_ASM_000444 /LENGTH=362 /DNA_ID=CAMNT_0013354569 /DNA_START=266 /DNA_END=1354 /DNA_ORIENTATION=+
MLDAADIAVLVAFGWFLVPSSRIAYSFLNPAAAKTRPKVASDEEGSEGDAGDGGFKRSYLFFVVDHLSQIARLALLVYAFDCVVVAFEALGYEAKAASKVFAKIVYTSWLARRVQCFKSALLRRIMNNSPSKCDKCKFLDRMLNGIVLSLLIVKILEYLRVETGLALGSIFAVGTTGGLIISLASQEIAKGVANGVEMAAADRFYVGDNVHFGDGTKGFIEHMGFLRTKIRKYDSSVVDIPNAQLGGQRIINISRTHVCRILTELRFEYEDVPKIPDALEAVKEEIIAACPRLIREGKPFRAMISGFERGYVEATVNCSFELQPSGEEFWANREQMFLAIDRGVRKSGIRYAKPVYYLKHDS